MVLLATLPLMTGNAAAVELGDVGEPPQLSRTDAIVTKVRGWDRQRFTLLSTHNDVFSRKRLQCVAQ